MKLYIVMHGYQPSIYGVFDTQEAAQTLVDRLRNPEQDDDFEVPFIQEWELNDIEASLKEHSTGAFHWFGTVEWVLGMWHYGYHKYSSWEFSVPHWDGEFYGVRITRSKETDTPEEIYLDCIGTTQQKCDDTLRQVVRQIKDETLVIGDIEVLFPEIS